MTPSSKAAASSSEASERIPQAKVVHSKGTTTIDVDFGADLCRVHTQSVQDLLHTYRVGVAEFPEVPNFGDPHQRIRFENLNDLVERRLKIAAIFLRAFAIAPPPALEIGDAIQLKKTLLNCGDAFQLQNSLRARAEGKPEARIQTIHGRKNLFHTIPPALEHLIIKKTRA